MNHNQQENFERLDDAQMLQIDRLCSRFETALHSKRPLRIELIVKELPQELRRAGLAELLSIEIQFRQQQGRPLTLKDLIARFPKVNSGWLAKQLKAASTETEFGVVSNPTPSVHLPETLGDYRILGHLGSGGMGTVYRAEHCRMGRQVALKVLRPEIQTTPELLQRFDREVRAAARLSHPNIVAALDAREADGQHFLVTELVDGADLEATVRQHGSLLVERAVDCVLQAARGLAYAHSQGVIHRDIKPAKLLLAHDGTVKILDMGLARLVAQDESASTQLTQTGVIMGTAAYMPPEQARDTRRADARSDIYSLGCTLFFLLHGRTAFSGASQVEMILSHVNQPIPSLKKENPKVPSELDDVFQQMVAKAPIDRIQTAADLVIRLERILADIQQGDDSATNVEYNLDFAAVAGTSLSTLAGLKWPVPDGAEQALEVKSNTLPLKTTSVGTRRFSTNRHRGRRTQLFWMAGAAMLVITVVFIGIIMNQGAGKHDPVHTKISKAGSGQASPGALVESDHAGQGTAVALLTSQEPERYSLQFNGTNSFASVPELVPESGRSYTLEAMIHPEEFRLSDVLAWMGPDWMAIYLNEAGQIGAARRINGDSHLVQGSISISLNRWLHVAATFGENEISVFLDGQLMEASRQTFELPETTGGLFVGGFDSFRVPPDQSDRFFAGQIAGIRISEGVRYQTAFPVPPRMRPDARTVAAFLLDEDKETRSVGRDSHGGKWTLRTTNVVWRPLAGIDQPIKE